MVKRMPLETKEGEEILSCGSSTLKSNDDGKLVSNSIIELLDECWFFRNLLNGTNILIIRSKPPPSPPKCAVPSADKAKEPVPLMVGEKPVEKDSVVLTAEASRDDPSLTRSLLRTPSLPPQIRPEENDHLKLQQHSCSALENHQSASPSKMTRSISVRRHKSSRYCINNQYFYMRTEASFDEAFQEKNWKSLSDLECEEVQGFKDLGFVFDDKESLSGNLLKVIPGLHEKRIEEKAISRPYLSETWQVRRPAAPPAIRLADGRTAKKMKEQLKLWARAVACNARQEC